MTKNKQEETNHDDVDEHQRQVDLARLALVKEFDRVFPLIGGHNLYQWLLFLIVSFQRGVVVFHHIGYIFLGASPSHWCSIPELSNNNITSFSQEQIKNISIPRNQITGKYSECEYYDLNYKQLVLDQENYNTIVSRLNVSVVATKQCNAWIYDQSIYHSTVVTQFDLVCDRRYLVATIQATYMAGIFVGSLILGALSDKILGRRRTALLCMCIIICFGFATAYASNYTMFILCRFFIAIGVAGSGQNCFTILMEYSDKSIRATLGLITQVAFALFYMLMPAYAYLIRDWSELQLAFSISTLTLVVYFWILPESSRWLAQNGREEEALDILESIAKTNSYPKPNRAELKAILDSIDHHHTNAPIAHRDDDQTKLRKFWIGFKHFASSYGNLVKTPELRKRSFLIWFLYMAMSFTYYGVSFGSPTLSKDPFIIVFLGGLMEIPGYLIVIPSVQYWGRKPTTIVGLFVAGITYVAVIFVPTEMSWLRITFAMASKLFISGVSAIIILLATELYPTEARSTGLGSAVLFGRIGSITAPYIVTMKFSYEQMSIIIIGIVAILGGLLSFLLPETKDEELFDNVDEIEDEAVIRRRASSIHSHELHVLDSLRNSLRRSSRGETPTHTHNNT